MDIKYTNDGKKVAVLGKLNSQESIVQEIFVVNGNEIPSGENFVVSSLHDAPAKSWKQKELERLEERYEKDSKDYENRINEIKSRYNNLKSQLQAKIDYAGKVLKQLSPESFKDLENFLTGKINYVVVLSKWDVPQLLTLDEFHNISEYSQEKLRLISLYGQDDGSLSFQRHSYSDGSGMGATEFKIFETYDEAFQEFKNIILTLKASDKIIEICKKYKIELSKEQIKEYKDSKKKYLNKYIQEEKQKIEGYEKSILEIESFYPEIV